MMASGVGEPTRVGEPPTREASRWLKRSGLGHTGYRRFTGERECERGAE